MARKLGSKDKKKRKSRGLLTNSALLGVPTGLGLGGATIASNYWTYSKGKKLGDKEFKRSIKEFKDTKSKPYKEELAKQIRNMSKPQLEKIDPEFIRMRDQPADSFAQGLSRMSDPEYKARYDRVWGQKNLYKQVIKDIERNNRTQINNYKAQQKDAIINYNNRLSKDAVDYADKNTSKVYNAAYSKVKRANLIKGGLIGLGVGSALLGANELRKRMSKKK